MDICQATATTTAQLPTWCWRRLGCLGGLLGPRSTHRCQFLGASSVWEYIPSEERVGRTWRSHSVIHIHLTRSNIQITSSRSCSRLLILLRERLFEHVEELAGHIESDRPRQTDQPRFGNDEKDLLDIQQVHCEVLGSLSSLRC